MTTIKEATKCFLFIGTILAVVIATHPISDSQPRKNLEERKLRARRQNGDGSEYKDCDATPPYLPPTVTGTSTRLENLRKLMLSNSLAAYIVPSEDAHQSEYIADRDKRRKYISGFSGSAGLAIITANKAALWTDGRYFLQAELELDCNWILQKKGEPDVPTPEDWLIEELSEGDVVGFDPTVMSISEYETYNKTFEETAGGPVLASLTENLVDNVWELDVGAPRPAYPDEPLKILDWQKFTGETWQQKIWEYDGSDDLHSVRSKLKEAEADTLVVSKLDEIAWLFNLRGKDIPYNPMFVSYAIITLDSIRLYMYDKDGRLTDDVKTHLEIGTGNCTDENTIARECVTVKDYSAFLGDLSGLSSTKIWISDQMSYAIYERVPETKRYIMASPILIMKAVKSPKEIEGMNNAHLKDSVALCRLGAWLQKTIDGLEDPTVGDIDVLSELIVEDKAIEFRSEMEFYEGESFRAISAFGPNAAVIHYSSSEKTNVAITTENTFLLDSGGQYLDGTVDITRTFHFGEPTAFMKEAYTRILLGQIDLALTTIRNGVYGREIDAIARDALRRAGLDYKHSTGHGIGHFLNVHEPPARIGYGYRPNDQPLQLGMFQSDEPGYYEAGLFGIRLEDIMYTVEAETNHKFSNFTYMSWRMCSLVPLEPILIDFSLFQPKQIDYYNAYNRRIRDEVGPRLLEQDQAAYKWMMSKTDEISYTFTLSTASQMLSASICVMIISIALTRLLFL